MIVEYAWSSPFHSTYQNYRSVGTFKVSFVFCRKTMIRILNLSFLFTLISDEPERGNSKLRRNQSLKKSFRKMAEAVHLRPKKSPSNFMFRASKVLRKSRQPDARLTENASPNRVFGQNLENLEMDTFGLPKFLPKVISKIEGQISTEGLYRINGDLNFVSKLR